MVYFLIKYEYGQFHQQVKLVPASVLNFYLILMWTIKEQNWKFVPPKTFSKSNILANKTFL